MCIYDITQVTSLSFMQAELEVIHPLYPTIFNFIHNWKQTQILIMAQQQVSDKIKIYEKGIFFLTGQVNEFGNLISSRKSVHFPTFIYHHGKTLI